ncbi:hypothetical protein J6590_068923 [Homalodisca vitripennis]|nr:hypothetical protein J6590_068923 [Homalodisca vitripennis]
MDNKSSSPETVTLFVNKAKTTKDLTEKEGEMVVIIFLLILPRNCRLTKAFITVNNTFNLPRF